MSTTKSSPFLSPPLIDAVPTNVDSAATSSQSAKETERRRAWQKLIDYQLIEWGWNTTPFEDEGIEPPTRDIVQLAIDLAKGRRDAGEAAPTSVVPDPNGGIVFEHREKDVAHVYHVWDDGTIEYQCYHGTRLVARRPL